jgi:hypothetical protein
MPTNTSNVYLDFQVSDTDGYTLLNAQITCNGVTKLTSSHGFARFEVPKNNTYPWTVQRDNYYSLSGSTTITTSNEMEYVVLTWKGYTPTPTPTTTIPPTGQPTQPGPAPGEVESFEDAIQPWIDNMYMIGMLALLVLIINLLKMM